MQQNKFLNKKETYENNNLKKIKVVFIDIDGTLRNSKRELSTKTIETVKKIQSLGINVILCSGRNRNHTQNVSKCVGASEYIISSNGADVYDFKNNKEIYNSFIDKKSCKEIYKIANINNLRFIMNVDNGRYVTDEQDKKENDIILNEEIESFLERKNVAQCVLLDKDFYKIKRIQKEIESIENICAINKSKSLIFENEPIDKKRTYLDLVSNNTSKGNAVQQMCKYLNISLDEAMAFGDSVNDISMLQIVGLPIVMGNATEEIKKYGKIIADSNDNNGVAKALEMLYHIKK